MTEIRHIGIGSLWSNPYPGTKEEIEDRYLEYLTFLIEDAHVDIKLLANLHNKELVDIFDNPTPHKDILMKAAEWAFNNME